MSSTAGNLLHKGADGLRKQAAVIEDLRQKVAGHEDLISAIGLVETCIKAGRLAETPESIVKRAERLLAEGQYDTLKKQAESGGIHIDPSLIGDLKVDHTATKEAKENNQMVEIDPDNDFQQWLLGRAGT